MTVNFDIYRTIARRRKKKKKKDIVLNKILKKMERRGESWKIKDTHISLYTLRFIAVVHYWRWAHLKRVLCKWTVTKASHSSFIHNCQSPCCLICVVNPLHPFPSLDFDKIRIILWQIRVKHGKLLSYHQN